jgi:hypothetical protein
VVHDDEHALSVAARLAAAQGVSLNDFCRHLGLDLRSIAGGRAEVIRELAYLANVDASSLRKNSLIHQDGFFTVGEERLLAINFSSHPYRYCPHCLAADRAHGTGSLKARPYGRVSWLISFVSTCDVHERGLLSAESLDRWRIDSEFSVFEFDADVDPNSAPARACTGFEHYMYSRLRGMLKTNEMFLDGLPLHVAGSLCELVGKATTHRRVFGSLPEQDGGMDAVRQAGFNLLNRSGSPFKDFLREIVIERRSKGGKAAVNTMYYQIYRCLKYTLKHPDFDCARSIVREASIEGLPLGPRDNVFGPIEVRRWHSLGTASKEFGIRMPALGRMLEAAGIISKYDVKAPNAEMIPEPVMNAFARWLPTLLDKEQTRQLLGVSAPIFERLLELKLLAPFVHRLGMGDMTLRYDPQEVASLLSRMRGSESVSSAPDGSLDILEVRASAGCTLAEIVELLINKALKHVYIHDTKLGIRSIHVDPEEVRQIMASRAPNVVQFAVCSRGFLGLPNVMKLVKEGYLATVDVPWSISGRPITALAAWSIELFEDRYAPLAELALRLFTDARSLRRELEEEGVVPFLNNPNPDKTLYDVMEVARLKLGEGLL